MSHIKAVHHIGVLTADMERSLRFYRDALGGTIVHSFDIPSGTINMVGFGEAVVELVPMSPPASLASGAPACGLAHFALTVDDTRAAYETALAAGGKARHDEARGNASWHKESCPRLRFRTRRRDNRILSAALENTVWRTIARWFTQA